MKREKKGVRILWANGNGRKERESHNSKYRCRIFRDVADTRVIVEVVVVAVRLETDGGGT